MSDPNSWKAWGGNWAAVVHVEIIGWRLFDRPTPDDWSVQVPHDGASVSFPFNPFRPPAFPDLDRDLVVGDYVRLVGTQWEDVCHCRAGIGPGRYIGSGVDGVPSQDPDFERAEDAKACWHAGSFDQGQFGRGWTEIHPVDYLAKLDAPPAHQDRLALLALCGSCEIRQTIRLPTAPPFAGARVGFEEISTPWTVQPSDIETKEIAPVADGIDVHIKLKPRGLFQGDPKYYAGFHVFWTQ